MNDLDSLMRNVFRSAIFFMAGCLLAWAFSPYLKPYVAGLVLGTTISLINGRIMGYKIHKMTEAAMANEGNGKRVGSGYAGRISMVLIGTMISVKVPEFNLITTIIGFFFVQFAAFFLGVFQRKIT